MSLSDILTFLVCGCLPFLLGGLVIVLGTRTRFLLGKRMFRGIADGKSKLWNQPRNSNKLTIILSIALISIIGLITVLVAVAIFHVPVTSLLQKIFLLLLVALLITSIFASKEIFGPIDKGL